MGYLYGSKCESRCLLSCLHLDRISDSLFSRVFCDGRVIIAGFSRRQRRYFFLCLTADSEVVPGIANQH